MKAAHLQQGEEAEAACCDHLISHGLKLVTRNYRCRMGEIDIIMLDKDMLVFIEVRFRKNSYFGSGLESITPAKQIKLRRAAESYLQQNKHFKNARFDVVSMTKNTQTNEAQQQYAFQWITDAF